MDIELLDEPASTEIAEYNPVAAGLAELKRKYANVVVDVSTTKALDEAKRVRAEIREPRYETEKIRKALKAPALAHAKLIDTEAARIVAELLAIETPWDDAIKAEEARKEAEKAAREAAEKARILAITERIAGIRQYVELAASCRTAARIYELQEKLARISMDGFEEFSDEAAAAHADAMKRVEALLVEKHLQEQEQERVKAEQAAQTAALKAEREALAAQQAELAAAKAAALAEQERSIKAAKAAAIAEADRIAMERQKLADEAALARAEIERQKLELALQRQQQEQAEKDRIARVLGEEQPATTVEQALLADLDRPNFLPPEQSTDVKDDARDETAMWTAITNAEPSDAEVAWTAIKACSDEYGWTTEQATKRLASITYL